MSIQNAMVTVKGKKVLSIYLCKTIFLGDRAECSHCGKWLHKRGLKRHIEDVHNHSTSKPEFICDVCNKTFKTPQYLKNHLRLAHSIYQHHSF